MTGGYTFGATHVQEKTAATIFQIDKSFITNIVFICYE